MISQSPVWFGNEKIYEERKRKKKKVRWIYLYRETHRERERENYVHDIGGVK